MQQQIRRKAEERVERRVNFFTHLVIYIVFNTGIFFAWYFISDKGKGFPWYVIVLTGWGIGLFAHFLSVFVFDRLRERLIEKEVDRISKGMK